MKYFEVTATLKRALGDIRILEIATNDAANENLPQYRMYDIRHAIDKATYIRDELQKLMETTWEDD